MTQELTAAQELLTDSFDRVRELVEKLTEGVSAEAMKYRADSEANTIAWLLWHIGRVQDGQVAAISGVEQVWTAEGWAEKFNLPFDDEASGYGQSSVEVGQVSAAAELLAGYCRAVHKMVDTYLRSVTTEELHRIIDDSWDPPVTVSARLISIVSDCLQHAGQAAYLRGLAERAN